MKHLFIPYELAIIAKTKGFNEECIAYYDKIDKHLLISSSVLSELCAPLYQQIVDWFDSKGIKIRQSFEDNKWTLFMAKDGNNDVIENFTTKEKAIEEAFKLI